MDIKINSNEGNFKFRVAGILWKNDKILLGRMRDNGHFSFPGGHVHIGESTLSSVKREMEEETDQNVEVLSLYCIMENFYEDKKEDVHEIAFYYNVKFENDNLAIDDFVRFDDEDGKLDFRWFDIEELKNVDIRPVALKEKLLSKNSTFEIIVHNGIKNN